MQKKTDGGVKGEEKGKVAVKMEYTPVNIVLF